MTTHGFRLYLLTVHDGRKRAKIGMAEELDLSGQHAQEAFVSRALALHNEPRTGSLRYPRPADDGNAVDNTAPDKEPVIRIESVVTIGNRVDVEVWFGRSGDHETAISTIGEPDLPLNGRAPSRRYRVIVYFPKAGDTAVMIAETRARTHVGELLPQLLSVVDAEAAAADGRRDGWLRWHPAPITDPDRVEDLIKEGSVLEVTLRRRGYAADGRPATGDLMLKQTGLPITRRDKLVQVVSGWLGRGGRDTPEAREEAADELAALIGDTVGGLGFNDGEVRFLENGQSQTIKPSNVERLFVYPIGDYRPHIDKLAKEGVKRLIRLRTSLGIPVDFGLDEEE